MEEVVWKRWFAWYPVMIDNSTRMAWLRYVYWAELYEHGSGTHEVIGTINRIKP